MVEADELRDLVVFVLQGDVQLCVVVQAVAGPVLWWWWWWCVVVVVVVVVVLLRCCFCFCCCC